MKKNTKLLLLRPIPFLSLTLFLSAILNIPNSLAINIYTHQQDKLPPHLDRVANPPIKDFSNTKTSLKNKDQDKRLTVAIIGTGVDYNLGLINKNLKYVKDGESYRVGYDFVGKDNFPAPYLAFSGHLIEENWNFHDGAFIGDNEIHTKRLNLLAARVPALKKHLNPLRHLRHESKNFTFHETQIAWLYAKHTDLNILSYRILPFTFIYGDGGKELLRASVFYRKRFLDSLKKAIADGADIINISHGFDFVNSFDTDEGEYLQFKNSLRSIVKSAPNVLFVGAAGNGVVRVNKNKEKYRMGVMVGNKSLKDEMLPCTLSEKNVLCVGSSDDNGKRSQFSNHTDESKQEFILARGENLMTKNPSFMCCGKTIEDYLNFNNEKFYMQLNNKLLLSKLKKECLENPIVFGTSYSTVFAVKRILENMKKQKLTFWESYQQIINKKKE